jgi:uncharacterized protein
MDDGWRDAVHAFDEGRFWDAHEHLEPVWMAATAVDRSWAAGVILLCAALHKARAMGSARGGRRNYAKALRHLVFVPDVYGGTDVRELEARVHAGLRDPRSRVVWPHATEALG